MSKKRKEPLGPFAGVDRLPSQGLPSDALGVLGTKITLHEDASGTISSAVERNLLLLGNDENNLVDRFDVRLLMDDISGVTSIRPTSASAVADQDLEEELDEERYADLVQSGEVDATDVLTASADTTLEHGASYQAVGLSYGEDSAAPEVSEAVPLFDPAFDVPPEHQHAMRDMTEQQHKVMMQTARFVRQEGDQLELVLRIRQGRNVSFSFLRPDSPLYEYYRWLVHAQPQAREEGQPGSPTATDNRQHEEPGGSLSHLVSMYGASQNPSHDDTGSPSPEGDKTEVDAREAGCDPTSAPPSGEGAEDHPIREGASQPGEAPPTPGSAEQGHGRRVFAGGGGCEVTEQPAQRAKRAEQPPAEVQGIVAKLLAFVKKSGVKFEASIRKRESSNPRFGFLLPGHPFHGYYRAQMMAVLGEKKAAELIAPLPADATVGQLEQSRSAPSTAPAMQAPKAQAPSEPVQVTIRSNPSLARIPFARRQTPLAKAATTGNIEAEDTQEPDQASAGSPEPSGVPELEGSQAGTDAVQGAGKRSIDVSGSNDHASTEDAGDRNASPGPSDLLMEGDAEQHAQRASVALAKAFDKGQGLEAALQAAAEAEARKADEALKAERRRLAMQLLAARRSAAEKARTKERGAPTAQAIARHRLALLAEESESQDGEPEEEAEAGEITVAKSENIPHGAHVRVVSLPKLEEVIRPPPPKQESSSEGEGSSSSGANDSSQHKLNTRGGMRMRSSPDNGNRSDSPRRQRGAKRSAGRSSERSAKRKSRRSAASSEEDSSGSDGRHRRKPSSHTEHRRSERSRENTESHERRKHKRPKHKKDAGRKGEEQLLRQSKASDKPGSSKSAATQKRRSEKRHDWGNTGLEPKQRAASSVAEDRDHTVSVSEVPDALRARIKAMLAKS